MSKIIFLDIDGVLVTFNSMKTFKSSKKFDPLCVSILRYIIKKENCKVVLSSTWRILENLYELAKLQLLEVGIPIIDKTPRLNEERGDEILKWICLNSDIYNITNIAILDDSSDMSCLKKYHIKTDVYDGLKKSDISKILETLSYSILI